MAARLRQSEVTRRRLPADRAHEIRTPVATLDGYLEGLEDGVATWDADTAVMLRPRTRRLARIAEDITAGSEAEEHQLGICLRFPPPRGSRWIRRRQPPPTATPRRAWH